MKLNQKGFSAVEVLLVIIALTLISGTGYYVYDSNKDESPSSSTTTSSENSKQKKTSKTEELPQKSDQEQIIEAVKNYRGNGIVEGVIGTVEVQEIVSDNARGIASYEPTGAEYIAHKADGKWEVVYLGQQKPGKEIGIKYGLPSAWYSSEY